MIMRGPLIFSCHPGCLRSDRVLKACTQFSDNIQVVCKVANRPECPECPWVSLSTHWVALVHSAGPGSVLVDFSISWMPCAVILSDSWWSPSIPAY